MPVKSKAQWHKFWAMYRRKEISRKELDEWIKGVDYDTLPEEVGKKKAKKKRKKK